MMHSGQNCVTNIVRYYKENTVRTGYDSESTHDRQVHLQLSTRYSKKERQNIGRKIHVKVSHQKSRLAPSQSKTDDCALYLTNLYNNFKQLDNDGQTHELKLVVPMKELLPSLSTDRQIIGTIDLIEIEDKTSICIYEFKSHVVREKYLRCSKPAISTSHLNNARHQLCLYQAIFSRFTTMCVTGKIRPVMLSMCDEANISPGLFRFIGGPTTIDKLIKKLCGLVSKFMLGKTIDETLYINHINILDIEDINELDIDNLECLKQSIEMSKEERQSCISAMLSLWLTSGKRYYTPATSYKPFRLKRQCHSRKE